MAAPKLKYAVGNSASTTLSSSMTNTDTSTPLTSTSNFDDAPVDGEGMLIIDEGQSSEELVYSTGRSGGSLTTPLANRGLEGGSAQAHSNNATVKGILSAGMWNDLIESVRNILDETTGAIDTTAVVTPTGTQTLTNKTLTSPVLNGSLTGTGIVDEDDMSSNSATKVPTQQSVKAYVDASGGGQTSSAHVYNSGSQSISDGVETVLTFDSESWDTDTIHSTSSNTGRLTIPTGGTGKWELKGQVQYQANASGSRYILIKKNGTTQVAANTPKADGAFSTRGQISVTVDASATDYFELLAYQNSGGSLNVESGAGVSFFQCHRLS